MSNSFPMHDRNGQPQSTLRTVVIDTEQELHTLAPTWEELLQRSSSNEPMLSPLWLLPWWEIYGCNTGRRLQVGLILDGDRLVGLAPLQWRRYWYRPGLPFVRLEWLGAKVEEADDVCSEYLHLIAEHGREAEVAAAFAAALRDGSFAPWDELVLAPLDGEHPLTGLLTNALLRQGWSPVLTPQTTSPYIPLPGTWEAYVQKLASRHRRSLLKALREFDQWAEGTAQYHRASTSAALEQAAKLLHTLHAERWTEAGKAGVFHAPRFARFHEQILSRFFAAGAVDLQWLTVRGEPLAINYSLLWNRKLYFYQCGRKMGLPRQARVGIALHAQVIRTAIAAGCREYDFLGGEAQYKQQLALTARPLVQLRVVQSRARQQLLDLAERGLDWLRWMRNYWRGLRASRQKTSAAPTTLADEPTAE